MLFNSFTFLVSFAVLAAVYYALPHRLRWPLLLAASLGFYAAFRIEFLALLLGVAAVAFGGGLAIERAGSPVSRRLWLAAGCIAVLGTLFAFKYLDFFAQSIDGLGIGPGLPRLNLAVAAGLSFYSFSAVSYLVDVYRGHLPAERHAGYLTLYIAFFPKLLAGPIERAKPFLDQVRRPVVFGQAAVTSGLQIFLWGLFKKVVVADRLAAFVDTAYRQTSFAPPADLVLATYFFAFQLYCDFSGYSDMAIGTAKVLGFDLMENFKRPYLSTSVPEFWSHRWHLSLSAWFRDYLYIPLGGSRVSRVRQALNVMAVFLVSGLWHGANWTFVVWGGLNGAFSVLSTSVSRTLRHEGPPRLPRAVSAIGGALLTFHLVLITWVFFRAASLDDAVTVFRRVGESIGPLPGLVWTRLGTSDVLVSVLLVAILLVVEVLDEARPLWERLRQRPVYVRWAAYYAIILALIVLGSWNLQQFVYMSF